MQEGVWVRNSCGNKYLVIFVLKCIIKSQNKRFNFLFNTILITLGFTTVKDLLSARFPVFLWLSTFNVWPHSSLVERIGLSKAINIDFEAAFLLVLHAEVIPLTMTVGIGVYPHVKVILWFWNPDTKNYTSMARFRFPPSNWLLNSIPWRFRISRFLSHGVSQSTSFKIFTYLSDVLGIKFL